MHHFNEIASVREMLVMKSVDKKLSIITTVQENCINEQQEK
jgi:hypothetical protein